jgi:glycosyltransferase involved in cell wall biosynthesis
VVQVLAEFRARRAILHGAYCLIPKLVIVTEIIAPYRIPVFNALAKREELELHVIFLSENDPSLRQWRVYKEEIKFQYHVLPSWRRRFGRFNVLINGGVFSALNKIGPHSVLCGGYNYLASWECAYWARLHRVPLLLWSESTAFDRRRGHRFVEFMKSRFLNMCSAFVVPGRSSFEYLQNLEISDRRIFTAPNAVDVHLFSALAEEARRNEPEVRAAHSLPLRYFLYVGRLVRDKGILDLVGAYSQLNDEIRAKIGLVFVGDGPDRGELTEQASRITTGTIQFAGFVHREELPQFYALADALIFPTRSDPWGLVVNEAMSCALPVIVTSVAGCTADLVQDGWNGFVTSPGNVSQLASAMRQLADDLTLRAEMGSRSRERIEAYSPAAWAAGLVKATEYVCARQP